MKCLTARIASSLFGLASLCGCHGYVTADDPYPIAPTIAASADKDSYVYARDRYVYYALSAQYLPPPRLGPDLLPAGYRFHDATPAAMMSIGDVCKDTRIDLDNGKNTEALSVYLSTSGLPPKNDDQYIPIYGFSLDRSHGPLNCRDVGFISRFTPPLLAQAAHVDLFIVERLGQSSNLPVADVVKIIADVGFAAAGTPAADLAAQPIINRIGEQAQKTVNNGLSVNGDTGRSVTISLDDPGATRFMIPMIYRDPDSREKDRFVGSVVIALETRASVLVPARNPLPDYRGATFNDVLDLNSGDANKVSYKTEILLLRDKISSTMKAQEVSDTCEAAMSKFSDLSRLDQAWAVVQVLKRHPGFNNELGITWNECVTNNFADPIFQKVNLGIKPKDAFADPPTRRVAAN